MVCTAETASVQRRKLYIRTGGVGSSDEFVFVYIIKLLVSNHMFLDLINSELLLYLVVWPKRVEMHVSDGYLQKICPLKIEDTSNESKVFEVLKNL